MPRQHFAVDAALLHELGERLIGRPAIALGELVKNSFDADAGVCRIEFGDDEIVVSDDGSGLSRKDFLRYWMRIGTTHKVEERVSKRFGRALTGSKGIGRLAAQFLGERMELVSNSSATSGTLHAEVNWTTAKRGADLSTVTVDWRIEGRGSAGDSYPGGSPRGTTIRISGLRNVWTQSDIAELGNEVWLLRSPFRAQAPIPAADEFVVEVDAPGITGARDIFDRRLSALFDNWKARIRGELENGRSGARALITVEFKSGYPQGSDRERVQMAVALPVRPDSKPPTLVDAASFEILVFKAQGRQPGGITVGELRDYLAKFGNVSLYDAGFRLPYYGSKRDKAGEDWLSIAADQGRRINQSELLPQRLRTATKYMQYLPAPGRIFGAVEIDTNRERRAAARSRGKSGGIHLQIQPGRDRLQDNEAFYQLRDLVRFSMDFYANRFRLRDLQAKERAAATGKSSRERLSSALRAVEKNRAEIGPAAYRLIRDQLKAAERSVVAEEDLADRRAALLAPLASAGMTALALAHELSRESALLEILSRRLGALARKHPIAELSTLAHDFASAKGRLDAIRDLFTPLLAEQDSTATERLRVWVVVEHTVRSMGALMPRVQFATSGVPRDLYFPAGSFAEWSAVLQNILSNSWNAMLDSIEHRVDIRGGSRSDGVQFLRVSDTGQGLGIAIHESERLFEPFERRMSISPERKSIAIGGQGLGLAIVRMIARRREVVPSFVPPEEGYSTTFQLSWRT